MNILTRQIINEARKYIGHEETSTNDSPLIGPWLRRVGVKKPSAWCAAFAWCMLDDACKVVGVKNTVAPTASVHRLVRRAKEAGLWTAEPGPGYLFFHDAGKGKGHCGIVEELGHEEFFSEGKMIEMNDWLATIEGNTNAAGEREGRLCMRKNRAMDYPSLGYLDPSKLLEDAKI